MVIHSRRFYLLYLPIILVPIFGCMSAWEQANNNFTPPHILARLADDSDVEVRMLVAKHRNTLAGPLAKLSQDVAAWDN